MEREIETFVFHFAHIAERRANVLPARAAEVTQYDNCSNMSVVCLLYTSNDRSIRPLNRERSIPAFNCRVASHFNLGLEIFSRR